MDAQCILHDRIAGSANVEDATYPARLLPPEFPGHVLVKRVTTGGTFRFGKRLHYVANAPTNQSIGLEETDDRRWSIYFHTVLLATLDERDYIIQS